MELETRKNAISLAIIKILEEPISKCLNCIYYATNVREYYTTLKSHGLVPMVKQCEERSISTILEIMLGLSEPTIKRYGYTCGCQRPFGHRVRDAKEEFLNAKRGVCLDCLKLKAKSSKREECRISHP